MQRTVRLIALTVLVALAFTICAITLTAQEQPTLLSQQNLDSLSATLNFKYSQLTSPALEARKHVRRNLQRKGYANILSDELMNDGFSALLSFIKTKIQIEYSISHRPLFFTFRVERSGGKTWTIPLPDEWAFPANPWEKP